MRYPTGKAKITIETEYETIVMFSDDIEMKMIYSPVIGWNWSVNTNGFDSQYKDKIKRTFYWEDPNAEPNGIGPVCIFCKKLIDSYDCHDNSCPVKMTPRNA